MGGMTGVIYKDLENIILYKPAEVTGYGCTRLKIVTGFTDCERISTHLIELKDGIDVGKYNKPITIEMILGMTKGSGLTQKKHNDIVRTIRNLNSTKNMPRISCRYIYNGVNVHTKLYEWENSSGIPLVAFCGSVNYSMQAFRIRREAVTRCEPVSALMYYDLLINDTVDCLDKNVYDKIKFSKRVIGNQFEFDPDENDYDYYNKLVPIDYLRVSLLGAKGDIGYGSSVNWGIRPNGTPRNPNQAYIPYNKADKKDGFFPDRVHADDRNCPIFRVITKSRGSFHMRMAQQGNKALHSAESNAIIGEWIRHEMGIPTGSFVTKQMLENYGKTYVTFRRYNDGTYLLDF